MYKTNLSDDLDQTEKIVSLVVDVIPLTKRESATDVEADGFIQALATPPEVDIVVEFHDAVVEELRAFVIVRWMFVQDCGFIGVDALQRTEGSDILHLENELVEAARSEFRNLLVATLKSTFGRIVDIGSQDFLTDHRPFS